MNIKLISKMFLGEIRGDACGVDIPRESPGIIYTILQTITCWKVSENNYVKLDSETREIFIEVNLVNPFVVWGEFAITMEATHKSVYLRHTLINVSLRPRLQHDDWLKLNMIRSFNPK